MKIQYILIITLIFALSNVTLAGGKCKQIKTIGNSKPVKLKSKSTSKLEGKGHGATDLRAIHNKAFHGKKCK